MSIVDASNGIFKCWIFGYIFVWWGTWKLWCSFYALIWCSKCKKKKGNIYFCAFYLTCVTLVCFVPLIPIRFCVTSYVVWFVLCFDSVLCCALLQNCEVILCNLVRCSLTVLWDTLLRCYDWWILCQRIFTRNLLETLIYVILSFWIPIASP